MEVGFFNYEAALTNARISQVSDVQMRALFQKHAGSRYANSPGSQWRTFPPAAADSLKARCRFNVAASVMPVNLFRFIEYHLLKVAI